MEELLPFNTETHLHDLLEHKTRLAVVGLGYVGLPLAVAFSKTFDVVGFDISSDKVNLYRKGVDPTDEVGSDAIACCSVDFTDDPSTLCDASFIVVAVPTPIHSDKTPDLTLMKQASSMIGQYISPGTVVVFESTVYPGVTEDICCQLIEDASGLTCGKDFSIGYSPERVNPGDRVHTLETITKIISAQSPAVLDLMEQVYGTIVCTGGGSLFRADSIRVAEAAKLLENAQRDVNIAFMNEMALGLHCMGIDTMDVVQAMNTKWNALGFKPGLVGGHCIGVDPYYFVYETESLGFHSSLISAARRVNDDLPKHVAHEIVREIIRSGFNPAEMKIYLLGMTFKGNCPDLRNTKTADVMRELEDYGLTVSISDAVAHPQDVEREFKQGPVSLKDIHDADCLIFTADHDAYRTLTPSDLSKMFNPHGCRLIADVRNLFDKSEVVTQGCRYWNL